MADDQAADDDREDARKQVHQEAMPAHGPERRHHFEAPPIRISQPRSTTDAKVATQGAPSDDKPQKNQANTKEQKPNPVSAEIAKAVEHDMFRHFRLPIRSELFIFR